MSSDADKRREKVRAAVAAVRRLGMENVLCAQAVADRLGLNLTDFECSNLLDLMGPLSAGKLAELTGLTTGAITGVVDRLEKAGFARRARDPSDRRVVRIENVRGREAEVDRVVGPMEEALERLFAPKTDPELESLCAFFDAFGDTLREEARKLRGAAPAESEERVFSTPLGALERGRLRFASGASHVAFRVDASMPDLYRARFEGRPPTVHVREGTVSIQYRRFSFRDWRKVAAEVTLNGRVPWDIELLGGLSKLTADFEGVKLDSLELSGGVSEVIATLPRPEGTVPIRVTGGASNVVLQRPAGVPVRAQVTGGVSMLALDQQHFGAIGGQAKLESEGYSGAKNRYEVEVTGGASNLAIRTR